jgi:Holliday junction resolvase RusA-like endonuclease
MEFIVVGTPRSANAPNRSRRRWRERVSRAAHELLREEPGPETTDREISLLIVYFYQGETSLDVDNIAKSLLDGLKGVLFRDDQRVSEGSAKAVSAPAYR